MDELNLEECICPICLCILIEPVTMPCTHTLCYLCFTQNVEDTSLSCPMCRTRISNWARRAAKTKTLINKKLWADIQQCFPDKVKKRMNDCDDEDLEDAVFHPMINIAQPGEIRQEFEAQLKELEKQREIERRREQEASEKLIRKLQEEEQWQQRENKEREEQDLVLAQQLSKEKEKDNLQDDNLQIGKRQGTRCLSSLSTSQSLTDSRPSSTIDSLINKMREAERLKEEDRRENSPQVLSPFKYKCKTPSDIMVDLTECGRSSKSRGSSIVEVGSNNSSVMSLKNDCEVQVMMDMDKIITRPLSISSRESLNDMITPDNSKEIVRGGVSDTLRCRSTDSSDSIDGELRHFKPIRSCPLTPPRKLPSGAVVEAPLIRTTPRNLNKSGFSSPVQTLSDIDAGSPIMQRRLSELEEERKQNIKKLSKSTSTKSKSVTERTCNYSLQDMVDGCDAGKENNARGAKANENGAIKIEFENGQDFDDMPKLPKMIVPLKPNLDDDIVDLDIAPVLDDKSVIIVRSDSRKSKKRKMDHSPSLSDTALLQDQSILSSAKKKKKNHMQKLSDEKSMPKLSPQRSIMDWIVKGSASSALRNLEKATEKGDNETEDPLLDEGESFKQQCSVSSRIDSVPSRGVSKKGKISERSKNGNLQNKSYLLRKKLKHCRQYGDFIWDSLKTGRFAKSSRKVHKDSSSTNKNDDVDMCASIESNSQLTNKIQKPMDMVSKGTPSKRKVHLGHSSTISPHKRQKNSSTISPQKGQKSSTFSPHKEQNQRKPSSTSEESFLEEMSEREQQEYKDRMLAERLAKQYEMEVKMATQFYKMKGSDEEYNFRRKSKASTS